MNIRLARTLTVALVSYIDENRPEGTMDCSSAECVSLEKAFTEEKFDSVENLINKKILGLTEFENTIGSMIKEAVEKEVGDNAAMWAIGRGWTDKLRTLAKEEHLNDAMLARHFAEWGAKHKESLQDQETCKENPDSFTDEPKEMSVDEAMKYIDEKIAKTRASNSWEGVDVDKFLDEIRGREDRNDDNLPRYYGN